MTVAEITNEKLWMIMSEIEAIKSEFEADQLVASSQHSPEVQLFQQKLSEIKVSSLSLLIS